MLTEEGIAVLMCLHMLLFIGTNDNATVPACMHVCACHQSYIYHPMR